MPRVVDFTGTIRSLAERREPFVVATVVRTLGSSLGKPGFKAVVSKDGRILYGAVGGACPESAIATMAMDALRSGQARVVKVFLDDMNRALEGNLKSSNPDEVHVETNCGGMMEIYVDPYVPADRLIIVGHGGKDPVEEALVKSGKALGFETVVIDHLPVLSEDPDTLITDLDYDLGSFSFSETDSAVVLTHSEMDAPTLEVLSKHRLRYVGLLGSPQRAGETIRKLRVRGVPESFLDLLHAPVGADIGALTPEEICLSIMAEVVATKHGKQLPPKRLAVEDSELLTLRVTSKLV